MGFMQGVIEVSRRQSCAAFSFFCGFQDRDEMEVFRWWIWSWITIVNRLSAGKENKVVSQALYYPYWKISNVSFLSSSLLLWDSLYCVVPDGSFRPWFNTNDPELAEALYEAHTKFVRGYVPTSDERNELHAVAQTLVDTVPFQDFSASSSALSDPWEISVRKISGETERLLLESGWATRGENDDTLALPEAAALVLMAELVNICTGSEMCSLTDIPHSCKLAMQLLTWPPYSKNQVDSVTTEDCLLRLAIPRVTPSMAGPDPPGVILRKILKARDDRGCEELRATFRDKIQSYLFTLRQAKTNLEAQAIVEGFTRDLEANATQLKQELRSVALDAIIPKDGIAGLLIGAGAVLAGTASLGAGAALGLAGVWRGYRRERRKVLRDHWTSFLYGFEHQRFSIW